MYKTLTFLIFLFCQERLSKLRAAQEKELQDPLLRAKAALEVALQNEDYERAAPLYGAVQRLEQERDVLAMQELLQIQLEQKQDSEKSPQQPQLQEKRQSKEEKRQSTDPPRKVGDRPSLEITEIATFFLDQRPRGMFRMFGPKMDVSDVPGHTPPSGVGRRPDASMLNSRLHYPFNKPSSDDHPAP
jgi:hypothetical protein